VPRGYNHLGQTSTTSGATTAPASNPVVSHIGLTTATSPSTDNFFETASLTLNGYDYVVSNTTPATAPFPGCSPLDPGTFVFNGSGAYPVPTTTSCASPGAPTQGPADSHCAGQPAQPVTPAACSVTDAGSPPSEDAGSEDAGSADAATPAPGPCGENGTDYGATMYGTEADDDDCKYHVTYTSTPICENNGTYFIVTASYLAAADGGGAPLTGASTFAELCLSDTHPGPAQDGRPSPVGGKQLVVEGPPGTYTIGPVVFDAPGDWTVRFHFNELCCDISPESPHGHAAFHVTVP